MKNVAPWNNLALVIVLFWCHKKKVNFRIIWFIFDVEYSRWKPVGFYEENYNNYCTNKAHLNWLRHSGKFSYISWKHVFRNSWFLDFPEFRNQSKWRKYKWKPPVFKKKNSLDFFLSIIWFSFQICFFEVWGWKGTMYALFANSKYSGFLLFYQRLLKIQHALPSFDISQSKKCWGFSDIRQCLAPCSWIFRRNQIPSQSSPGCHTFQFLG